MKNNYTIKKSIKELSKSGDKDSLAVVTSEADYRLVRSYMQLIDSEEDMLKYVDSYVKVHPMWEAFFKDIKGCGTLMSGVCLAYLDPYKAKYVSSFYRYAGLDTVRDVDKYGNNVYITNDGKYSKVIEKYHFESDALIVNKNEGSLTLTEEFNENKQSYVYVDKYSNKYYKIYEFDTSGNPLYMYIDSKEGTTYSGDVFISEHGRRKGDTLLVDYVDKNGNTAQKRSISYNPVLKSKLMGVLSGCLIKAKDPIYSAIYYDYKSRLENDSKHATKTPAQRDMMAKRYMVKQFLRNLWVTWRNLEGLEVVEPYEVAKLGNKPHKYNEYQCMVAKLQRERV